MNKVLLVTIVFYVVISIVIWLLKPSFMFNYSGSIKQLGVNEDETIFYYPIVLVFLGIFLYVFFFKLFTQ